LRQLPSVEISIDGAISLRGNPNVTILVDGRPSSLTGSGRQAILEELPASMIERVEVITQPGARFDPDGMAGIINIVLKKNKLEGLNGNVRYTIGTSNNHDGSVGLNYKVGSWNFSSSVGGRWSERFGRGLSERSNFLESTTLLKQVSNSDNVGENKNARLGAEVKLPKGHSISADFSINAGFGEETERLNSLTTDPNLVLLSAYDRKTFSDNERTGMDFGFNWMQDNGAQKPKHNAAFRLGLGDNYNTNAFSQFNASGDAINLNESSISDGENQVFSGQYDHERRLGKDYKLEIGAKNTYRKIDDDFVFLMADSTGVMDSLDANRSNRFIFEESIWAAYTQVSGRKGAWDAQLGLRFEQAFTQSDLVTTDEQFVNDYFSLFPSLFINRELDDARKLGFSYTRRINRPGTREINPFPSYSDPLNLSKGNPFLQPEYAHAIEFTFQSSADKSSISATAYGRGVYGVVRRFRTVDSLGVSTTTFENIARSWNTGLELIWQWKPKKNIKLSQTFNAYRMTSDGSNLESNLNVDAFAWSYQFMGTWDFSKSWQAQLSGNYSSEQVMVQNTILPMYSADVTVKKGFLDDKLSFTLRVSDIFDTREFRMEGEGSNFNQLSHRKRQSRFAHFTIAWRFGKLEERKGSRGRGPRSNDGGGMDDGME
jgi:outer membrane receptor protein involved in Fe transport